MPIYAEVVFFLQLLGVKILVRSDHLRLKLFSINITISAFILIVSNNLRS